MTELRMTPPMLRPDYKEFSRLAGEATLVPVVKSVAADLLTPVSAFLAIAAHEPDAFLLESVERGEQIGRYTFLGARPYMQVRARGGDIVVQRGKKTGKAPGQRDPGHQGIAAAASSCDRARAAAVYRGRGGLLRV